MLKIDEFLMSKLPSFTRQFPTNALVGASLPEKTERRPSLTCANYLVQPQVYELFDAPQQDYYRLIRTYS